MTKDKKLLYILSGIFSGVLLLCCFVPKTANTNLWFALLTAVFAVVFGACVKKRRIPSYTFRQVFWVLLIAAFSLIAVYILSGLGFGYQKTPLVSAYWWRRIAPYALAIIGAEYIRHILLAQEIKSSGLFVYVIFVLFDAALFRQSNSLDRFSAFWEFASMTLLPALSANVLYTYVSKRYGFLPVIAYRIPLAVYPYLLPMAPLMPEAMLSFARFMLPLGVLGFLRSFYEKKRRLAAQKNKAWNMIASALSVLIMTAFIMLISCRFQYGLLVIATDSMTGSLNKGDAIIYEQYEGQALEEGQIIVFSSNSRRIVHRITRLRKINGVLQIYTKGDANEAEDAGFVTTADVIGTEVSSIPYLGYPTVWMRELFTNK